MNDRVTKDIEDFLKEMESRLSHTTGVPKDQFNPSGINWISRGPNDDYWKINQPYSGAFNNLGIPLEMDHEVYESLNRNQGLTDEFEEFLENHIDRLTSGQVPSVWSREKFEGVRPILSVFADWLAGRYRG